MRSTLQPCLVRQTQLCYNLTLGFCYSFREQSTLTFLRILLPFAGTICICQDSAWLPPGHLPACCIARGMVEGRSKEGSDGSLVAVMGPRAGELPSVASAPPGMETCSRRLLVRELVLPHTICFSSLTEARIPRARQLLAHSTEEACIGRKSKGCMLHMWTLQKGLSDQASRLAVPLRP